MPRRFDTVIDVKGVPRIEYINEHIFLNDDISVLYIFF